MGRCRHNPAYRGRFQLGRKPSANNVRQNVAIAMRAWGQLMIAKCNRLAIVRTNLPCLPLGRWVEIQPLPVRAEACNDGNMSPASSAKHSNVVHLAAVSAAPRPKRSCGG